MKSTRRIADLAGSEEIQAVHLAEALQYRPKLIMTQTEKKVMETSGQISAWFTLVTPPRFDPDEN